MATKTTKTPASTPRTETTPVEQSLAAICADLEQAQDCLARASHDLAHLARMTARDDLPPPPSVRAVITWALEMRRCAEQVTQTHQTTRLFLWLERTVHERRAERKAA